MSYIRIGYSLNKIGWKGINEGHYLFLSYEMRVDWLNKSSATSKRLRSSGTHKSSRRRR
ncbi:MAG: hypothetical protein LBR17_05470 [Bacteroidales bacterium]|nr:hypothetical protein [Bacteroidales bacterium]